jgi:ligand-binding sensor domain-containing protein/signal transduction histidine kinase
LFKFDSIIMQLNFRLTCLFFSLFYPVILLAYTPYYFNKYEVEDGLSNNTVFCSLQDRRGFLWFGTKDGLNRFDGTNFKVYQNIPNDKHSLGNNYVKSLAEDRSGNLWIGTARGLYRYNVSAESFSLIVPAEGLIRDIQVDQDQMIWFVCGWRLLRYDPVKKRTINYSNISSKRVTDISIAADHTMWISTSNGFLFKSNHTRSQFVRYQVFDQRSAGLSNWIESIFADGTDRVFIGTATGGLKLLHTRTGRVENLLTRSDDQTGIFVRCIVKKSASAYWVGTESGLYVYDLRNRSYINIKNNLKNPYSLSYNSVYTLLVDQEGGVWIGTFFGGLSYYPQQYTHFKKFMPGDDSYALSGSVVRAIQQDDTGKFWIGTEDGGLNKLDPTTNRIEKFLPGGKPGSLSYYNIHGLLADNNRLWIGTYQHGLDLMDIRSGKVIKHYSAGTSVGQLRSNFVYTIVKTKSEGILLGTRSGLYKYDEQRDRFLLIKHVPPDCFVHSIIEDHTGTIWIGTNGRGLFFYNPRTRLSGRLRCSLPNRQPLTESTVNSVYQDSKHQLWISTQQSGLARYNTINKTVTHVSMANGLPSNTVYQVTEDNQGTLWITTAKGLANMDLRATKIRVYTKAQGLLTDQFSYSSGFKDLHGNIYLGSIKGLVVLDPKKIKDDPFMPPVFVTGFHIQNQEASLNQKDALLHKSIIETDTISLNYDQASFNIGFAALSFTAPEMIQYAFKMDGLDKEWTYLNRNRKAYYTELPPGNYVFRVKASNSSGLWGTAERKLHIRIHPPLWASLPAKLLYAVLIVGGGILLIYLYDQRMKQKTSEKLERMALEKEKELYQAKIAFFTDVAHEIRTPLTLIKGPMEKVAKNVQELPSLKKNIETMARNTDRLMVLTQQLLDFRKVENQAFTMNFSTVDVCKLLKDICLNFNYSANSKKMKLSTDFPTKHFIAPIDPEAFTKIISNLLHNALKYGQQFIKVSLTTSSSTHPFFTIKIANGGPTIPEPHRERIFDSFFRLQENQVQQGFGIGLALAKSLAELHNGTLRYEVSEEQTNVFILTLPAER